MSTLLADVLLEEDNPSLVRNDAQELIPHTKVVLEDQASVKAALDEEVIRVRCRFQLIHDNFFPFFFQSRFMS